MATSTEYYIEGNIGTIAADATTLYFLVNASHGNLDLTGINTTSTAGVTLSTYSGTTDTPTAPAGLTSSATLGTLNTGKRKIGDNTYSPVIIAQNSYLKFSSVNVGAPGNTNSGDGWLEVNGKLETTGTFENNRTKTAPASHVSTVTVGSTGEIIVGGVLTNRGGCTITINNGGSFQSLSSVTNYYYVDVSGRFETGGTFSNLGSGDYSLLSVNDQGTVSLAALTNAKTNGSDMAATIIVQAGGTLTVDGSVTNQSVRVSKTDFIDGHPLIPYGYYGGITVSGILTGKGTFTNSGTLTIDSNGTLCAGGSLNSSNEFVPTGGKTFTNSGTLDSNGSIYAAAVTNSGTLTVTGASLAPVTFNAASFSNSSSVSVAGFTNSTISISGTVSNSGKSANSGGMTILNSTAEVKGKFTNSGALGITNSTVTVGTPENTSEILYNSGSGNITFASDARNSSLTVYGELKNSGKLTVSTKSDGGTASITVNGKFTNSNTSASPAELTVDAGSSFSANSFVNNNGKFTFVYQDAGTNISIGSFNNSGGTLTIDVTDYLDHYAEKPVAAISGITFTSLSGTIQLVDSEGSSVSGVSYMLNANNELVLGAPPIFVNAKWTDTRPDSVTYNNRTYTLTSGNAFSNVQDAINAASSGATIVFFSTGGGSDIGDFKFYPQGLVTIDKNLIFESNNKNKAVKFDSLKIVSGCTAEFRTGLYSLEDVLDNEGGTLKIVNKTRFNADLVKNANGTITLDKTSRLVAASIDAGVVEVRAGFVYNDLKWIERPYAAKIGDHATIKLVYPYVEGVSPVKQEGVVYETRTIEGKQYDVVVETITPGDQVYAKVVNGQYICYGTAAHHDRALPTGTGWDSFYAATEYGGLQLIDDAFDLSDADSNHIYNTAAIYVNSSGAFRTATLTSDELAEDSKTLTVSGTNLAAGNYSCSVTVENNVLHGKFVVDGDGNGTVAFMDYLAAGSYTIKLADPKYKATAAEAGTLSFAAAGLTAETGYRYSITTSNGVVLSGDCAVEDGKFKIDDEALVSGTSYTVVLTKGATFEANSQKLEDSDHRVTVSAESGGNPIVYDSFMGAMNSIYINGHTIGTPESGMIVRLQEGAYTEGDFSMVLGETTQCFVGIGANYNVIVEPDRWWDGKQWHYDNVSMVLGGTFGGITDRSNLMTFYKIKDLTIDDLVVGSNSTSGKEEISVVNFVDIENLTVNYRLKPMNAATIRILNSNVTSKRHFSVPGGTLIIENSHVKLVGQTEHGALSTENNAGGSGTVILRNSVFELQNSSAQSLIVNLKVNCEFTISGTCTVNGIFENLDESKGSDTYIAFRDAILDENTNIQAGTKIGAALRFEGYNVLDGTTVEQNGDKDMTIEVGSTLDMSGGASITVGGGVEVSNCGSITLDNASISAGSFTNEGSLTLSDGAEISLGVDGVFINKENGVLTAELQSDGSLGITTADGTPVPIENTGTIYIDLSKTDIPEDPYIVLEGLSGSGEVVVIGGGGEYKTDAPPGSTEPVPHIRLSVPPTETLYVNGEWRNQAVYKKGKNVGSYTYFGYNAFEDNGSTPRDLTFAADTSKVIYYGGSDYSHWTLPRIVNTITTQNDGTMTRYSNGDVVKDDDKYYAWKKKEGEIVTIFYTKTLDVVNGTQTYTWYEDTSSFDEASQVTVFTLLDSITLTTLGSMSTATLTATFTVGAGDARTVSIVVKDAKGKIIEKQNYSVAESGSEQTFKNVVFYSSRLSAAKADVSGYTVSIVDSGTTTPLDAWTVAALAVDRDTANLASLTTGNSQTVTLSGATMSLTAVSNAGTLKVETGESAKLVIPVAPSVSRRDVKVVVTIGSNEEHHTVQAAAGADSVTVESKSFAPGQEYTVSVMDTKQYSAVNNTLSVDVVSGNAPRTINVVARNADGVKYTFTNVSVGAGATKVELDPSPALDNTSGSISDNFSVSVDANGILTLTVTGEVEAQKVDAYIQKTVDDTIYRFDYTFNVDAHAQGDDPDTYTVSTRLSSDGYYYVEASEPEITAVAKVNGISGAQVKAGDVTNNGTLVVASQDTASGEPRKSAKLVLDVDRNDNASRWIEVVTGGHTYSLFVAKGASKAELDSENFTVGKEYSDVTIKDAYSTSITAEAGEGDTRTLTLEGLSSSDNVIRPDGPIVRTLKATVRDGAVVVDTYTITEISNGTAVISDSRLTAGKEYTVEVSDEKTVVATAETLAVFDSTGTVTNNAGKTITVTDATFNAGELVNSGTITITNSRLNANKTTTTSGTITNNSDITMDIDSLITAGSIENGGTITIDATSFNPAKTDMKKVIDLDNTSGTISGTGNLVLDAKPEQFEAGIGILYDSAEHDYWVVAANQSTLYVNSAWATDENGLAHKTGDLVGDKLYYGYNAFGSFTEAYAETLRVNPYTLNGNQQRIDKIEVYGPTAAESAKNALLFFGDDGKVVSNLEIAVHGDPGSTAVAVIPFLNDDYGINISPANDKAITIDSGITIQTEVSATLEPGDDQCSGTVYLNYQRTSGTIALNGTIDSAREIKIYGRTDVSKTGSLKAATLLWINSGATDATASGFDGTVTVIGTDGSWTASDPQVSAENIMISSGKLVVTDSKVASKGLVFGDGVDADDILLESTGTDWTLNNIGTQTGAKGTYQFSAGSITVTGNDSNTINNAGTVNPGEVAVGSGVTLNLTNMSFSALSVTNSGTITVDGTSTLNIGNLSGNAVQLQNGTELTGSSVRGGAINSDYGFTLSSNNSMYGVTLTATGDITNSDTLLINAATDISARSIAGGTIDLKLETIESPWSVRTDDDTLVHVTAEGENLSDVTLIVDGDTENPVASGSFKEGITIGDATYTLVKADQKIYLTEQTRDTLYVNSSYSGNNFGDLTDDGHIYGYNAFSSLDQITYGVRESGQTAQYPDTTEINLTAGTLSSSGGNHLYYTDKNVSLTGSGQVGIGYGRFYLMHAVTYKKKNTDDEWYTVYTIYNDEETAVTTENAATVLPQYTIASGLTLNMTNSGPLKIGDVLDYDNIMPQTDDPIVFDRTAGAARLLIEGKVTGNGSQLYLAPYSQVDIASTGRFSNTDPVSTSGTILRPNSILTVSGNRSALDAANDGNGEYQAVMDNVSFLDGGTISLASTRAQISQIRMEGLSDIEKTYGLIKPTNAVVSINNSYVETTDDYTGYKSETSFFTDGYEGSYVDRFKMEFGLTGSTLVVHNDFNPNAKTTVTINSSTLNANTITNSGTITMNNDSILIANSITNNATFQVSNSKVVGNAAALEVVRGTPDSTGTIYTNEGTLEISGSLFDYEYVINKESREIEILNSTFVVSDTLINKGAITVTAGTTEQQNTTTLEVNSVSETSTAPIIVEDKVTLKNSTVGGVNGTVKVQSGAILTLNGTNSFTTLDLSGASVRVTMDSQDRLSFTGFGSSYANKFTIDMSNYSYSRDGVGYLLLDSANNDWTEEMYQELLTNEWNPASASYKFVVKNGDLYAMDHFITATVAALGNDAVAKANPNDPDYDFGTIDGATSVIPDKIVVEGGVFTSTASSLKGIESIIEAGEFRSVMGGKSVSNSSGSDTITTGDISLTVQSGTFQKLVVAGDCSNAGTTIRCKDYDDDGGAGITYDKCDIEFNISGGEFSNPVVGGMAYMGTDDDTGMAALYGDVNLNITGGSFTSYLYGGSIARSKLVSGRTNINGNVTITVDAGSTPRTTTEKIVLNKVACGSYNTGTIMGSTKLVMTGLGENIVFLSSGEIWGGCGDDYYKANVERTFVTKVSGTRTLSFTGFNGELNSNCEKIRGFSHIEFVDRTWDAKTGTWTVYEYGDANSNEYGCKVELDTAGTGNYNLSDMKFWTFGENSSLSGKFKNDFKGDTLRLNGFADSGSQTLISTATDNASIVFNSFGGVDGEGTDSSITFAEIQMGTWDETNKLWTYETVNAVFHEAANAWTWDTYTLGLQTDVGLGTTSLILSRS